LLRCNCGLIESGDSGLIDFVIQDAGWNGGQHLMTRPLSNDLRERAVAAALAGESCRSVAARFGVAASSVVKWPPTWSLAAHLAYRECASYLRNSDLQPSKFRML
jgi:transposase-like protein